MALGEAGAAEVEVPLLGPYARWEDLPALRVAHPLLLPHKRPDNDDGGGWGVRWSQYERPEDDPDMERRLLRQVQRPRPARGWAAAAQSVCTFTPPVLALSFR